MLNTNQFLKLSKLLTKIADRKVYNVLRKSKSELPLNEYKQLHPTESSLGKIYETKKYRSYLKVIKSMSSLFDQLPQI